MKKNKIISIVLIVISITLYLSGCSAQYRSDSNNSASNPLFHRHIASNGAMISLVRKDGTMNAAFYTMVDLFSTNVEGWENIISIKQNGGTICGLSENGTLYCTHMPGSSNEPYTTREVAKDVIAFTPSVLSTTDLTTFLCVHKNGTVKAYGQIRDTVLAEDVGQNNVEDWKNIIEIESNGYHTLGLKKDGTVVATGLNNHSQCNVSNWENIVFIACGYLDSVGVQADGKVVYAGDNDHLRQKLAELSDVKTISLSRYNDESFLVLKKDGTVVFGDEYSREEFEDTVSSWSDIVEVYYGRWPDRTVGIGDELVIGLKQNGEILWYTPIENARTEIAAYFDKIGMLKTEE